MVNTFTILNGLPEIEPADILALKVPAADALPRLALHVPLEARDGAEEEVARFLQGARSAVEREPGTLSWYALRLGKTRFAIVDTFAESVLKPAQASWKHGQVPPWAFWMLITGARGDKGKPVYTDTGYGSTVTLPSLAGVPATVTRDVLTVAPLEGSLNEITGAVLSRFSVTRVLALFPAKSVATPVT